MQNNPKYRNILNLQDDPQVAARLHYPVSSKGPPNNVQIKDATRPIGIFGHYQTLILQSCEPLEGVKHIWAQELSLSMKGTTARVSPPSVRPPEVLPSSDGASLRWQTISAAPVRARRDIHLPGLEDWRRFYANVETRYARGKPGLGTGRIEPSQAAMSGGDS